MRVYSLISVAIIDLDDASDLGVHQFSISDNTIQAGKATAISQVAAAQIVDFIAKSRADVKFFTLITSTLPSEIYLVSHDVLRKLRVVTDGIWDEEWTFAATRCGVTAKNLPPAKWGSTLGVKFDSSFAWA